MPHILRESLSRRGTLLLWMERLLLAVGLLCLGLVAFAWLDARWFAYQQGRRLDLALRARASAGAAARRAAAAGGGAGAGGAGEAARAGQSASGASDTDRLDTFRPGGAPPSVAAPPAAEGTVLGRIEVPRVGISSLLLEGVASSTLRHGVGHIPGTALPQANGNVGVAGHRDTVFRGLKDIRKGDLVTLDTLDGSYRYSVDWAQVVDPKDVAVLAATNRPELTLVTCYPFYYVGSAPERFVVRGHLVGGDGAGAPASGSSATAGARPQATAAPGASQGTGTAGSSPR